MIAVLHNIRSIHNVGSIFRTADALGAEKIYLCGITPKPTDRLGKPREKFIKVSLGAEKSISWEAVVSTTRLLDKLKKQGWQIFAVEQSRSAVPYNKIKISKSRLKKTALVAGNEVRGLPKSVLGRADRVLEIPMAGKKESLNVAVAFGIVGFHLRDK